MKDNGRYDLSSKHQTFFMKLYPIEMMVSCISCETHYVNTSIENDRSIITINIYYWNKKILISFTHSVHFEIILIEYFSDNSFSLLPLHFLLFTLSDD